MGGLAIRNFETWLLGDIQTVARVLEVELSPIEDLETSDNTKKVLEDAIAASTYLSDPKINQRPLQIRWNLASEIDLGAIKTSCPNGYRVFSKSLIAVAKSI